MNREDIIRMARECGVKSLNPMGFFMTEQRAAFFERFAALVAAAEREECAKVCDAIMLDHWNLYKGRAPYKGNEPGRADPHEQGASSGADECADAIRARSKQ